MDDNTALDTTGKPQRVLGATFRYVIGYPLLFIGGVLVVGLLVSLGGLFLQIVTPLLVIGLVLLLGWGLLCTVAGIVLFPILWVVEGFARLASALRNQS